MRTRRFTVESVAADQVELRGREAHHARDVLRLAPGASVTLFDSTGARREGVIASVGDDAVVVRMSGESSAPARAALSLTLLAAALRGRRMDFAVEKAAELGVQQLVPYLSSRSAAREADWGGRADRWRRIVVAAAKQSGATAMMNVADLVPLEDALAGATGLRLLADPRAAATARELLPAGTATATVLVGPEGGLAPGEEERAATEGFAAFRLGPTVLRAETAAIAAAAHLIFLAEEPA